MQTMGGMTQPVQAEEPRSPEARIERILEEIRTRIGESNYQNWFLEKTEPALEGRRLTIGVASPFLLTWMQKSFRPALLEAARAVLGAEAKVELQVIAPSAEQATTAAAGETPRPRGESPAKKRRQPAAVPNGGGGSPGRRFASLLDFTEGPCNELALAAARQVCEAPGARFNPLVLHGGVGTGKTHLLEGIYASLRRSYPSLRLLYLDSESFANHFTQALREKSLPGFRRKFRTVDVFLVDDVQFFDGKRAIQEEFLHTFKQLLARHRQIVVTCDCHPRLLSRTTDELITRYVAGLVCRVEAPDPETRRKIVQQKAARLQLEATPEALEFVAARFRNNVRELEGALNCLATWQSMTGKRVGVSAARRMLTELERDCTRVVRLADIEQVVCDFFGVNDRELKSSSRHRAVSQPRMLAMFLARKHTHSAYSEIGRYFGGRNHATVMSAEKRVANWIQEGRQFRIASQSWQLDEVIGALEHRLQAS